MVRPVKQIRFHPVEAVYVDVLDIVYDPSLIGVQAWVSEPSGLSSETGGFYVNLPYPTLPVGVRVGVYQGEESQTSQGFAPIGEYNVWNLSLQGTVAASEQSYNMRVTPFAQSFIPLEVVCNEGNNLYETLALNTYFVPLGNTELFRTAAVVSLGIGDLSERFRILRGLYLLEIQRS